MTQKEPLLHKSLIICILHFERGDSQQVKSAFLYTPIGVAFDNSEKTDLLLLENNN